MIDELINIIDQGLRVSFGVQKSNFPHESEEETAELSKKEQREAASLMRVNHTGEVCAQGLYLGQALVARNPEIKEKLKQAASEERQHLGWCNSRLEELGDRRSVLDPVFYVASTALGVATGLMGDKISLGFVEATEDQVVEHLDRHLAELPEKDERSRDILTQIRGEEEEHGEAALEAGGREYPIAIRAIMTAASKTMTETTRYI